MGKKWSPAISCQVMPWLSSVHYHTLAGPHLSHSHVTWLAPRACIPPSPIFLMLFMDLIKYEPSKNSGRTCQPDRTPSIIAPPCFSMLPPPIRSSLFSFLISLLRWTKSPNYGYQYLFVL